MKTTQAIIALSLLGVVLAPLGAQPAVNMDSSKTQTQQPLTIQYLRAQDARGINVFEAPKEAGVTYTGFKLAWGAAFTQQFQGLTHENTADSAFVAAVNPTPGNTGSAANTNRNRLMTIGNGFNNATANLFMHAQLAKGIRVQLTSYLSARHHNETWVKDGFLQIDESPLDIKALNTLMKYATLKIGHFEVNYGDFHFRRSDNGQALYNPFVGNAVMDAFTTEIGAEAQLRHKGFLGVVAITNGEIRGDIARPADRAPALMAKLGFDRQLSRDLRVRLTGSLRTQQSAINNTLYSGDRAGSRYYFVLENDKATESGNFTSGAINPGFTDKGNSYMINPFVKFHGLELFGMYESAKGRSAPDNNPEREVKQYMAEAVYRFLPGEKVYVGGRWNSVEGDIGGLNKAITVTRGNIAAGWFITQSLELKGELVDQRYTGFAKSDIRNGGRFKGFVIEAITAF